MSNDDHDALNPAHQSFMDPFETQVDENDHWNDLNPAPRIIMNSAAIGAIDARANEASMVQNITQ